MPVGKQYSGIGNMETKLKWFLKFVIIVLATNWQQKISKPK